MKVKENWPLTISFIILALITFLHSGLVTNTTIFASQDTAVVFNLFSYISNNLVLGDIPQWNFYALNGQPFTYWLAQISPMMLFSALIGKVFGIQDNYNLFLLFTFLESFIFLYGSYLLCKELKINNKVILFTLLTLILTWIWATAFSTNFRSIYTYPYFLLFNLFYLKKGQISALFFAGLSLAITMLGSVGYYATLILYHYIFSIICIVIGRYRLNNKFKIKLFIFDKNLTISFILGILFVGIYLFFGTQVFFDDNLQFYRPGRDENMKIIKETIPYVWQLHIKEAFLQFFTGLPLGKLEPIVNIGALGFIGFISTIKFRNKLEKSTDLFLKFSLSVVSIWLILSTLFRFEPIFLNLFPSLRFEPIFLNLFPSLSYVRQTDLILAFLRIHLIFFTAVGLNQLLILFNEKNIDGLNTKQFLNTFIKIIKFCSYLILASIIFVIITSIGEDLIGRELITWSTRYAIVKPKFNIELCFFLVRIFTLFSLACFSIYFSSTKKFIKNLPFIFFLVGILELSLNFYLYTVFENNFVPSSEISEVRKKYKLELPNPTTKSFEEIESLERQFRTFSSIYWASGYTPCLPRASNDTISPRFVNLIKNGWGYNEKKLLSIIEGNKNFEKDSKNLKFLDKKYTACDSSLIRSVDSLKITENQNSAVLEIREAEKQIHSSNDYDVFEDDSGFLNRIKSNLTIYKETLKPEFKPNRVYLNVVPQKKPYLLYISMGFDSHWDINSDGNGARIFPANVAFTGIYVPENTSLIELKYQRQTIMKFFKLLTIVTTISLLTIIYIGTKSVLRESKL